MKLKKNRSCALQSVTVTVLQETDMSSPTGATITWIRDTYYQMEYLVHFLTGQSYFSVFQEQKSVLN